MVVTSPPKPKAFEQRKRLVVVQALAVAVIAMMLVARPAIGEATTTHEMIELIGLGLIFACVAGRLWSILYIGGRKNAELISCGPFSMTRNPLYFFSTLGAVGIGLIFGSAVVTVGLGLLSFLILGMTARKEAEFLLAQFGPAYQDYARRTPRFWPNPFLYRDEPEWRFSPAALRRTFLDGLYFIAAFPMIELLEHLRALHDLPVWIALY